MTAIRKLTLACCASAMAFGLAPSASAQSGTQYVGQVSAFGGSFCPRGWVPTNGQLLAISSNTALFSIIGTFYGGDGRTTFAMPDLRGRRPISQGNGPGLSPVSQGQRGGSESFTLSIAQLPPHSHSGSTRARREPGNTSNPKNKVLAVHPDFDRMYSTEGATVDMAGDSLAIGTTGGGQAVNKVSPFVVVQWCIAVEGIYPSRS